MQNKSICTKFVALIKKVFGFQHCFKERKLHISEDNIGILPSADTYARIRSRSRRCQTAEAT